MQIHTHTYEIGDNKLCCTWDVSCVFGISPTAAVNEGGRCNGSQMGEHYPLRRDQFMICTKTQQFLTGENLVNWPWQTKTDEKKNLLRLLLVKSAHMQVVVEDLCADFAKSVGLDLDTK